MNALVAILSPLVLLVPAAVTGELPAGSEGSTVHEAAERTDAPKTLTALPSRPFEVFSQARRSPELGQVRIEQRVIIRISPGPTSTREQLLADPRRQGTTQTRYRQEKLKGCVAVSSIAAMEPVPEQNRLLLFMRDRRILSVALERACNARDYYSGFYVERSEDGQICARRDQLQSRTGASCSVTQFYRLVAVGD